MMLKEFKLDDHVEQYMNLFCRAKVKTVYHTLDYLLAEEAAEVYPIYFYLYEEKNEFAILVNVKRRLNDLEWFKDLENDYFDLAAPHEFSGILASQWDDNLFEGLYTEFSLFCKEHHIVDHFIRFNPYSEEYRFALEYHIELSCNQIWIDCHETYIEKKFSKEKQRQLKKAFQQGLTCQEVKKKTEQVEIFKTLYKNSMDRLEARKLYYFSDEYFRKLMESDISKLYFVTKSQTDKVIAASVVLCDKYNKILYYHLSCRDDQFQNLRATELLIYTFSIDAQKAGYNIVHISGGHGSLLRFKSEFSDKRIAYYIGYKIFNQDIYNHGCNRITNLHPELQHESFFPLYRSLD